MELTKREHKILDFYILAVMTIILVIICGVFVLNSTELKKADKANKELKHQNK